MIFGTARLLTEAPERVAALRAVTEQLVPGRWDHARPPTRKELAATAVLELPLDEASVKVSTGPPKDDPEDYDTEIWAGIIPARLTLATTGPAPTMRMVARHPRQRLHIPLHDT